MDREDWIGHIIMVLAAAFATWIIHLVDPSWSALYGSIIAFTIIILLYFAVFWWMRWDLRRHIRRMEEFRTDLQKKNETHIFPP